MGRWPGLVVALGLLGCDASLGEFLNNVPVEDTRARAGEPTHVFLGVDGVSRRAFDTARARGAFASWQAADWIAFFPAVSDYSWMRMLRTGAMKGYELQHFDPATNELHGEGLAGVVEHPISQGLFDPLPCWAAFDFLGNGEAWTVKGYLDPEAALPGTLDEMFRVLERLGRTQAVALAYLMNVDVVSHSGGLVRAVDMLVELDRRLRDFQARHPGRFTFTLFSDHGNAHERAELVDPRVLLREVGVDPVETFGKGKTLQAVPIVHVRVNFVSVHTRPEEAGEVALRTSRHRWVDLAVADLGMRARAHRFGVFHQGEGLFFEQAGDGSFLVEAPQRWDELLGTRLAGGLAAGAPRQLTGDQSFALTFEGPYPDLFYRVATAFTNATVRDAPQVILSMPDDVASFGFHLPGGGDHAAMDGFHGALTRGSSLSVVASQSAALPAALRAESLLDVFPELRAHLAQKGF